MATTAVEAALRVARAVVDLVCDRRTGGVIPRLMPTRKHAPGTSGHSLSRQRVVAPRGRNIFWKSYIFVLRLLQPSPHGRGTTGCRVREHLSRSVTA